MRLALRTSALAGAILSLALVACGGGDDDGGDGDGDGTIDESGANHTYVVSAINLPENGTEAMQLGLDIDGKANDGVDNQLGSVIGSIGALAPDLDLQASLDESVDNGELALLVNVKATDLVNANGVGLWVYLATDQITPAPCTDPANPATCRKHLEGTGMFSVDSAGPQDAKLAGRIMAGKFTGGPGNVTLRIALAGTPIELPLQKARAEISMVSDNGWPAMGSKIGGAVAQTDINTKVIPAIGNTVRSSYEEGCPVPQGGTRTPPACNCADGSTGKTMQTLFDKSPKDCEITDAEVMSVVGGFLTPDIDLDGDGTNDALSLGLGVTAVKATFTVP